MQRKGPDPPLVDLGRRVDHRFARILEGERRPVVLADVPLAGDRHAAGPEVRCEGQGTVGERPAGGDAAHIEPAAVQRPLGPDALYRGFQEADVRPGVVLPLLARRTAGPALAPGHPVPAVLAGPVASLAEVGRILLRTVAHRADDHEALLRHQPVGAAARHGEVGVGRLDRPGQRHPHRRGRPFSSWGRPNRRHDDEGPLLALVREVGVRPFLHLIAVGALVFYGRAGGRGRRETQRQQSQGQELQLVSQWNPHQTPSSPANSGFR